MIRIGILSGDSSDTESIELIQQFKEFKIIGIAHNIGEKDILSQKYTAEDLACRSEVSYININNPSMEIIQMEIKKSNHLFIKQIPQLSVDNIKQLFNLANEASSIIQIHNPYVFLTENLRFTKQLNTQKLINIRLPLHTQQIKTQLQELVLFLTVTEKSELRKIDVFAFEGEQQISLLNIRIAFSTGSIAQINLFETLKPDQSLIEIFQKDKKCIAFKIDPINSKSIINSERGAMRQFINAIQQKEAMLISFSELEQASIIIDEIREKLKYCGSSLLV